MKTKQGVKKVPKEPVLTNTKPDRASLSESKPWNWLLVRRVILGLAIFSIVAHAFIMFLGKTVIGTPVLTFGMYAGIPLCFIEIINVCKLNRGLIIAMNGFCIPMTIGEVGVRNFSHQNQSYMEKENIAFYQSRYVVHNFWNDWDDVPGDPNSTNTVKKKEYTYDYHYNNEGFKGPDFFGEVPGVDIIDFLGDSFTEGLGTSDEGAYPMLVQNSIANRYGKRFRVLNHGKSGSDPVYQWWAFTHNFIKNHPKVVVMTANKSDIIDIAVRGGMERYDSTGKLNLTTGPWWEFFYGYSYSVRRMVHGMGYNELLKKEPGIPLQMQKRNNAGEIIEFQKNYAPSLYIAAQKMTATMLAMDAFCKERNIVFLTVFIPDVSEVTNGMDPDLQYVFNSLNDKGVNTLSLREYYIKSGVFNYPSPAEFYYQIDGHHTPHGYQLLADGVYEKLIPLLDSIK